MTGTWIFIPAQGWSGPCCLRSKLDLHPRKRLHFHQPAGISRRDSRLICSLCGLLLHSYLLTPFFGCSLVAVHPLFFSLSVYPGPLQGGLPFEIISPYCCCGFTLGLLHFNPPPPPPPTPAFFSSWCVINCHRLIPDISNYVEKNKTGFVELITAAFRRYSKTHSFPFFIGPLLYIRRIFRVNLDDFRLFYRIHHTHYWQWRRLRFSTWSSGIASRLFLRFSVAELWLPSIYFRSIFTCVISNVRLTILTSGMLVYILVSVSERGDC